MLHNNKEYPTSHPPYNYQFPNERNGQFHHPSAVQRGRGNLRGQYRGRGLVYRYGQPVAPRPGFQRWPQVPPLPQRVLRIEEDWRRWVEVTVVARGVPLEAETLDIYELLHKFGDISTIKLHRDKTQADGTMEVLVTFCPPPDKPVWDLSERLTFISSEDGRRFPITLKMMKTPKRDFTVKSPANPSIKFPERLSIDLDSLSFGFMLQENQMMIKKTIVQKNDSISLMVDLLRREVVLFFSMLTPATSAKGETVDPESHHFRMQIPLESLNVIWVDIDDDDAILTIPLTTPPEVYVKAQDASNCHEDGKDHWKYTHLWSRQTDFMDRRKISVETPLSIQQEHSVLNVGRWTTYRLKFNKRKQKSNFETIRQALVDHNVELKTFEGLRTMPNQAPQLWNWIDPPSDPKEISNAFLLSQDYYPLDFKVRYQLEACISQGCINEHNITKEFLQKLEAEASEYVVALLENVCESQKRYYQPLDIFHQVHVPRKALRKKPDPRWVYTRLVTVTPTSIVLGSPTLEVSNRIVREYNEHAEHFIRVKFSDETGALFSRGDKSLDPVYARVERCLLYGIKIGDRHFQFLASGNSQFREHGAFFFAPVGPSARITAKKIRDGIGDLRESESIAKYASRLGQCFSTTRAINGTKTRIVEIADIETTDGSYKFTDGVGKMSRFVAETIAQEFRLGDTPSLFQFRLGGCKGVFVVWDEAKGGDLHVRLSQYKFPAVHEGLGVIRCSEPCGATLNRQIIMILRSLGVDDSIFMVKLAHDIRSLDEAMKDENVALNLLQSRIDPLQSTLFIASMILNGFMKVKDPFMMSNLHLWRSWRFKRLKEKAAISIPKGVIAFGCTDETNTLKGYYRTTKGLQDRPLEEQLQHLPEIFLQTSDPTNRDKTTIIKGLCFVARNPSLHPGDIRVVRAVDNKRLHHIKDVVVFPQNGDRDIPSMCSGGDLDGDDFLVVWDPELIPTKWHEEPMLLAGSEKGSLNRDAKLSELARNFVHHMKFDNVGQIAIAHLAQADLLDEYGGVRHPKCLRLAELHSTAVDFPKTGKPAELDYSMKPSRYPHYLPSKGPRRTYRSRTPIGRIYDSVSLIDFDPLLDLPFDSRILTAYELEPAMLQAATELKFEYDREMRQIMKKHDIETEFEIWTGFVLKHDGKSKDYKLHEVIGRSKDAVCSHFQELCRERAGGREFEKLGPFVAAMYTITEKTRTDALKQARKDQLRVKGDQPAPFTEMNRNERPLISFPWLFPAELGKIANGEESNVTGVALAVQGLAHRHKVKATEASHEGGDDIETAGGVTHRGETLELFHDAKEHQIDEEGVDVGDIKPNKRLLDATLPNGSTRGIDVAAAILGSDSEDEGEIVELNLNQGSSALEILEKLAME